MSFKYLRVMHGSDLKQVLQIEQAAYQFPWTEQGFENCLDQGLNFVFCDADDQMVGYSCILPVLDEAHLLNFCVSPKSQRLGIGRQAMQKILQRLLEAKYQMVFLEVRESNTKARDLYVSLGFSEDGMRPNYYRCQEWDDDQQCLVDSKEDAVLMSYQLSRLRLGVE